MALRIEDYALIGDGETAALVGRNGSIDWFCCPRFDSGACFSALLGSAENGHWTIAARDHNARITRNYRSDTLILETQFETESGTATLIDFMPVRDSRASIVRLVNCQSGSVTFATELIIRFGYGEIVPWVTRSDDDRLRAIAGPDMLVLQASTPLRGEGLKTVGEFTVGKGESASFVLTYVPSHLPQPPQRDPWELLRGTEKLWRDWCSRCQVKGPWVEAVKRSLITLKALCYAPTGGLVAAPTTSLPERLGGRRNWDYRYCWLRDATLTLLAFTNSGYYEEARNWREWLLRAVAGSPNQMQIMYGVAGERRLTEMEIPWLRGYEASTPVRVGNDAHLQLQLDVYGEMLDAMHQARKGLLASDESGWELQLAIVEHLERTWREPDHGIWESRNKPEHFTHSKVMAWVAFDRSIKSAESFNLRGPIERWRAVQREIHHDICARGFDAELGTFVRAYGTKQLDASLLQLPIVGFLPAGDPRIVGTIAAIERTLMHNGLLRRYDTEKSDDGLPSGEGVFLACSFWLVDVYVSLGRYQEARTLFERLLGLRNDVGLLSEQYEPEAGRLIGNFPQAFSHLALVNGACNLMRGGEPIKERIEASEKHVTEGRRATQDEVPV